MIKINPDWFNPALETPESKALNNTILKIMANWNNWAHSPVETRRLREEGKGPFPLAPLSKRAYWHECNGVKCRVIEPKTPPRGAYLHIHGGGWVLGTSDMQDGRLEMIADQAGLVVISVEYRLAPEFPHPCGNDDCEAAALWLVTQGASHFGVSRFYIGGESAGAHLSLTTLLRLRDKHGLTPFHGANLHAGCYDLNRTPSVRNFKGGRLILDNHDIDMFARHYTVKGGSLYDPDISPMYAELHDLPPALFTVGSRDPLVDDTLLMASKWVVAGNKADLEVYNGGCHVFIGFPCENAAKANAKIWAFLNS